MYTTGAIANLKSFEASLRSGKALDNAVECTNSTLTAILGRKAAYEGRIVTWDEMFRDEKAHKVNLSL